MGKQKTSTATKVEAAQAQQPEAIVGAAEATEAQKSDASADAAGDANAQDSKVPHTDHDNGQGLDVPGAHEAAPGGESSTGAVLNADEIEPVGGWCYPILTPSTFNNVLVKEGFIQLTRAEAAPYIAAGVLADDPCYPPGQEPAE